MMEIRIELGGPGYSINDSHSWGLDRALSGLGPKAAVSALKDSDIAPYNKEAGGKVL